MISRLAHSLKDAAAHVSSALHHAAASASSSALPEEVPVGDRTVRIVRLLGEGGFSFVYEVVDVMTGETFALKKMVSQDPESQTIAEKEIVLLKRLTEIKAPNVCKFYGACKREVTHPAGVEFFLLMEYCPLGSFIELVKDHSRRLNEKRIAELFLAAAIGLSALHSLEPPIAHRDVKLENFLLKSPNEVRLCDFGSCTSRAQVYSTREEMAKEEERIGKYSTPMYRAPEMCDLYRRDKISEKVDVWALGTILYALAFFTHPFQDGGNLQILSAQYFIPDQHPYSHYLTSLIKRLLNPKPDQRPNIQDVIRMCKMWIEWLNQQNKSGGATAVPSNEQDWASFDPPAAPAASSLPLKTPKDDKEKKKVKKVKKKTDSTAAVTPSNNAASFQADFEADFNPDFGSDWNPFPSGTGSAPNQPVQSPPSSSSSSSSSSVFTSSGPSTQNLFDLSSLGHSMPTRSVSVPPQSTHLHSQSQSHSQSLQHSHANSHSHSMNNLTHNEPKSAGAHPSASNSGANSVFDSFDWSLQPSGNPSSSISPSNSAGNNQFGFGAPSQSQSQSQSHSSRRTRHAGAGNSATPIDLSKLDTSNFKKSGSSQAPNSFTVPDLKGKLSKPAPSAAAAAPVAQSKARIISADVAASDDESDASEDQASSDEESSDEH